MGSSKNCFSTSGYHYAEVENNFVNISAKQKIFWGVDLDLDLGTFDLWK